MTSSSSRRVSPPSSIALLESAEIAEFIKAETHLLAVAGMPPSLFLTEGFLPEELLEEEKKRTQEILDEGIKLLKEQGFNVELANWRGIFAAPGITKAQQEALIKAVETATKDKSWEETLKRQDWGAFWLAGEQYGAFIDSETKRIGEILAGLNLGK